MARSQEATISFQAAFSGRKLFDLSWPGDFKPVHCCGSDGVFLPCWDFLGFDMHACYFQDPFFMREHLTREAFVRIEPVLTDFFSEKHGDNVFLETGHDCDCGGRDCNIEVEIIPKDTTATYQVVKKGKKRKII